MDIFLNAIGKIVIEHTDEIKLVSYSALSEISKTYNNLLQPWSVSRSDITFNSESGVGFTEAFEELKKIVTEIRKVGFLVYGAIFIISQDTDEVQLFKIYWNKDSEREVAAFKPYLNDK